VSSMMRNGDSIRCAVICASSERTLLRHYLPLATSLIKSRTSIKTRAEENLLGQ
jgi:hypothetical protein